MAIKDRITNIIDSIKASTEKKDVMKPIGPNINTFTWNESINPSGKIAVYTCLYGSYDKLHEPEYIADNIDYIVFTDEKIKKHSKWIKKDIPYKYIYDLDKKRLARYAKLLPHKVLPEYEYSIYVDANIIVKGDITKYIKSLTDYPVAMSWHPLRRCLYKEGLAFYIMKKITKREFRKQMRIYREEGMPEDFGLTENNVIVRKHKDKRCIKLMETWWEDYNRFGKRDQLCFPYSIWRSGLTMDTMGHFPVNSRFMPEIKIVTHRGRY